MIRRAEPRVAFLFLGEMLLVPHLYPIVPALIARRPDLAIDLWVSTSVHERLLARWLPPGCRATVRRAPGFLALDNYAEGQNPPLPSKLRMLVGLLPHLLRADAVVCCERTSLWLPTLLPLPTRFIMTEHGSGALRNLKSNRRRRAAWRSLVAGPFDRDDFVASGMEPARVVVTGYVKAAMPTCDRTRPRFPEPRPTILYAPHWRNNSSWGPWGRDILTALAVQSRYNIIFAPHQRLVENDSSVREAAAGMASYSHVHVDLDSFAMVDGSYTSAADLYLGDNSSQVVEFIARPRPCLFLNPGRLAWETSADQYFWHCGEVIDQLDALLPALDRAADAHPRFRPEQERLARDLLGDASGAGAARAADEVLAALAR